MKNKQYKRSNKWENRNFVIGIDEVGRGSLAGPVMAVAVMIKNSKFKIRNSKQNSMFQTRNSKHNFGRLENWNLEFVSNFPLYASNLKFRDSKKLSLKQREAIYNIITRDKNIVWGRGLVGAKMIDKINILEATKLAMRRAVKNLRKKRGEKLSRNKTILIIDGNQGISSDYFETPIVKADEKIFLCSCASIIAKVQRDNLMKKYEKIYSQYGFAKHKGYPTKSHKKMIKKHRLSPIHRKSFRINKNKTEKERNPRANYY